MARVFNTILVVVALGYWCPGQSSGHDDDRQDFLHLHFGQQHPPEEPTEPSNCQYWCRTPEEHFYCCRDNQTTDPIEHDGYCPATRAVCTTTHKPLPSADLPRFDHRGIAFPDMPQFCATDGSCESYEKCCFDRCFRRHVCKFAFSEGGRLMFSNAEGLQADVVQHAFAYDPNRLQS